MPFAQVHYPFENKEWFETHYPADFITEYVGQTRGWFNTLIMMATGVFEGTLLEGKPPFKNCICHGVVLDSETGLKYSKRLKNYKNPLEVIEQFGADALRWLMMDSPVMRGHDLSVDPEGKFIRDVVRLHIKPIWNAYNFFTLYANADGVKAEFDTSSENLMDKYILAKCREAVEQIEQGLNAYDTPKACAAISNFFEVLNNWYIRRNKDRFWNESNDSTDQAAYNTLYSVLITMCKAGAPLLPYSMEEIYGGLAGDSVHLTDFPKAKALPEDDRLIDNMDFTRNICTTGLAIRSKNNIRVRQPLSKATIYFNPELQISLFENLISEELNVKEVIYSFALTEHAESKLKINFPELGKRLKKEGKETKMKEIIGASKKSEWKEAQIENDVSNLQSTFSHIEIAGEILSEYNQEFQLLLTPKNSENAQAISTNDALVVLDLTLTPELKAEGIARDFVRMVQEARKTADLQVSNRIALQVNATGETAQAIDANKAYIMEQVLATELQMCKVETTHSFEQELDGAMVAFGFKVA